MAFPAGYVPSEAQEAIALSVIAYSGEKGTYSQISTAITAALADQAILGKHLTLAWLGISADLGNLCYVAKDDRQPNRYAIACRGTDWAFFVDWVDDLDVLDTHDWPTANPPDPSILVAQGSWDGLVALRTMTSADGRRVSPIPRWQHG